MVQGVARVAAATLAVQAPSGAGFDPMVGG
jgi:hypothetical protein